MTHDPCSLTVIVGVDGASGNVVTGSVRDGLLELARRVDLLVIGSHPRSALGRLLQGSTADAPLRELPAVPAFALHTSIGSPS